MHIDTGNTGGIVDAKPTLPFFLSICHEAERVITKQENLVSMGKEIPLRVVDNTNIKYTKV